MSFREKSAWLMGALMLGAGAYYLTMAFAVWGETGSAAPPLALFIPFTLLVVIASVAGQTTLALLTPREANAPADEREKPLLDRAGHWSGLMLAAGTVTSLLYFFDHQNGVLLFHTIMGSLIVSQLADYALQIALIRRAS
ncbi:hypothetical protein [Glacieibacterium frigidum]|uniref:Transmembrane protein n=1 Tax=Glacieibacterium frigidum TaxID=2593303 RepID=A0A552UJ02_9SPHN|nr:hypothetical protein [Glacieibacterium frigidum]TRW18202.1 hypothetical protein FMM06_08910 [Glacieibacterium frigidum]